MISFIQPDSKNDYYREDSFKIFFAGTIDNGDSEDWQKDLYCKLCFHDIAVIELGQNYCTPEKCNITIFNPRRENWNENTTQEDLEKQIKWEQEKLDEADLIIMYLAENSKSPISLLELGLYGQTGKVIVYCTNKFYRYTNVKLTCEKYFIEFHDTLDHFEIADRVFEIYDKEIKK